MLATETLLQPKAVRWPHGSPFMRHEYLAALVKAAALSPTGWTPRFHDALGGDELHAACALYPKPIPMASTCSTGPGPRLRTARPGLLPQGAGGGALHAGARRAPVCWRASATARAALLRAVVQWCSARLSSLHLLFAADDDVAACEQSRPDAAPYRPVPLEEHAPTLGTGVSSPPEGAFRLWGGPAAKPAIVISTPSSPP